MMHRMREKFCIKFDVWMLELVLDMLRLVRRELSGQLHRQPQTTVCQSEDSLGWC